jgi:HPt (histidine-containing phosphotransfer) domain-containing protein
MTANAMRGDRERCIDAGMDDYVTKPINVEILVNALYRATSGAAPPAAVVTAAQLPAAETSGDALAIFNRREALERTAGDEELLAQIIEIFTAETPALLESIGRLIDSGDHEGAFRAAHTLKGSSANLSAKRTSAAAREIELAARSGDLVTARARLAALQQAVTELMAALSLACAHDFQPASSGVPS